MTTVLITGAAGFVGSNLSDRLVREGFDVVDTDLAHREPPPDRYKSGGRRFEPLDFTDAGQVRELFTKVAPQGVIHAGAVVGEQMALADVARTLQVNVNGTQFLLDAAVTIGARFTYLSTATLYGTHTDLHPLSETDLPDPVEMYDGTKLMAEVLLISYKRVFGLTGCAVRFGFPYGYGQWIDQYFVPRAIRGERIVEAAGGDHPCDFTYIDDLVDGILRAHTSPVLHHDVYNVTGGVLRTRRDLAKAVMEAIPGAVVDIGPGLQPGRHLRGACDLSRARADLGYEPRFSLEEGVADWVRRLKAAGSIDAVTP